MLLLLEFCKIPFIALVEYVELQSIHPNLSNMLSSCLLIRILRVVEFCKENSIELEECVGLQITHQKLGNRLSSCRSWPSTTGALACPPRHH